MKDSNIKKGTVSFETKPVLPENLPDLVRQMIIDDPALYVQTVILQLKKIIIKY